jgi:membrane fusion protein (multidrug efflux system)
MPRFVTRFFFLVVIPVCCLAVAGYLYYTGGRYVVTENAYVKTKLVNISSDIDGRVVDVPVVNNQAVTKGDLLFVIDPQPAEIELMAARAEVKSVSQRIDSLKSQYQGTLLEIDDAQERIRFLTSQMKRQEKLKQQGHGLEIDYDQARHNLEMGRRALISARRNTSTILADLAGDPELAAELHPLHLSAQAKVNRALRDLESTRVRAPSDGILSNVNLEAGEYVEAGDLVFSIVETGKTWIEANLKESQLTHLKEGQAATVVVDAYPDYKFLARVTSLSPATGAEFAVLPPQNATGNWVKVVQRIPVRLDIFSADTDPDLRAGMTTTVKIDTGYEREVPELLQPVIASVKNLR